MRILVRVAGLAVVALFLTACGGDDEPVSSGPGTGGSGDDDLNSIEGEYVATTVQEGGRPRELVDGTTIRLRLEDGGLSASAGCNTIGGEYTIDQGVLRVNALAMTEMGCDGPRHAQDDWLAGVLSAEPRLEQVEEGFVLRTAAVAITFVDHSVVDPDRALVGTTWVVDGYLAGTGPDDAVSSAVGDTAMVVFDDSGFVTGHDGCNGFGYGGEAGAEPTDGLRYEVTGDQIAFSGDAITTLIGCPDLDTDSFWAVLSGTVTWSIDGSRLTLVTSDDRGVSYQAHE